MVKKLFAVDEMNLQRCIAKVSSKLCRPVTASEVVRYLIDHYSFNLLTTPCEENLIEYFDRNRGQAIDPALVTFRTLIMVIGETFSPALTLSLFALISLFRFAQTMAEPPSKQAIFSRLQVVQLVDCSHRSSRRLVTALKPFPPQWGERLSFWQLPRYELHPAIHDISKSLAIQQGFTHIYSVSQQ